MFQNVKAYFATEYLNIFKSGHTSDVICAHIVTVRFYDQYSLGLWSKINVWILN